MSGLYAIQGVLGSGATAVVVAATRVGDPDRELALKVLRANACDRRMLARAADEAAVLRQLRHPNLLHVYRLVDYGDHVVVESERVNGSGLDRILQAGPLPTGESLSIARQIALGLDAAFNTPSPVDARPLHVVHRDVKPGNVLLTATGGVKVLDFGMACSRLTPLEAGEMRGTPGYCPPESLTGADLPAVDVYALALVLVEMLLGKPLVLSRVRDRHDEQVTAGLGHLARLELPMGLGPSLIQLLQGMLSHDPMERPLLPDVAARLTRMVHHPDLQANLTALVATRHVAPPATRPSLTGLAFLENRLPLPAPAVRPGAEVEQEVRERLSEPDWMSDLPGLRRLLASADRRVEQPLLDLLRTRSWQFWRRAIRPEEQEGALLLLAVDPSPDAVLRARTLQHVDDERVASAARQVLVGL